MSRLLFPATTALLSAATFAGVWTMTGQAIGSNIAAPPVAYAVDRPDPVPVANTPGPASGNHAGHRARSKLRSKRVVRRHRETPVYARSSSAGSPRMALAQVWYPGCHAVRAAGAAPLYRGQPGYRPEMDGDHDGIACEPYRGG